MVAFAELDRTEQTSALYQETFNPVVYNKLSCHLPWIAEQYDMDFDTGEEFRETGAISSEAEEPSNAYDT